MESSLIPCTDFAALAQHIAQYLAAKDWTRQAERQLTFELLSALAAPDAATLINALRKQKGVKRILSLVNPYLPQADRDSNWLVIPCSATIDSWRPYLAQGKLPHKVKALPSSNPAQDFAALLESFAKKSPAHSDFAAIVKDAMRREYTFSF